LQKNQTGLVIWLSCNGTINGDTLHWVNLVLWWHLNQTLLQWNTQSL